MNRFGEKHSVDTVIDRASLKVDMRNDINPVDCPGNGTQ